LINSQKKAAWLKQMESLEVDFYDDQRLFFAEIAKLRGKKKGGALLHSL
jgi:hypothetical protein